MPYQQSRWNLSRDEEQLAKELVSNQIHVNELPERVPNEARSELIKRWAYCIHLSLQTVVSSNSAPPPEGRAHQLAAEIMSDNPANWRDLITHEILTLNSRRLSNLVNSLSAEISGRRRPHVQAQQPQLRQRRLPRPDDSNNSSSQSHSRGGGSRANRSRGPRR